MCRTETNHFCEADHHGRLRPGGPGGDMLEGYRLWICAGCETGTLEEYEMLVRSAEEEGSWVDTDETDQWYYPERNQFHVAGKQFKQLPPKLTKIYREALQAFNNEMGMLCAIGIRALVEGICADQEITGRNLEARIEGLSTILPKNIVSNLHSIRFMGNDAAHELNPPPQDELRLAIEICEDLLNFIYELDYKASQLSRVQRNRKDPC
jgi:hypothetical protein